MRVGLRATVFAIVGLVAAPALAASIATDAFVADARLDAVFLARASALASERATGSELRAFAARQVRAEDAFTVALSTRGRPAAEVAGLETEVVTGRSVAVRGQEPGTTSAGTGALVPAAALALDQLARSDGATFDALYRATALDALRRLAARCAAYARTGDDPALRQVATEEFAAAGARIADVPRL